MDRLHGKRAPIEAALCGKEKTLFSLKESILLYDLTSTYFEGLCLSNPKAKRGYSRDSRPDCKQVVVGLVLDGDGFPKAHEIFAGNRGDPTTVADMLKVLQMRMGKSKDATVVVDRGMSNPENLASIRDAGYHWLVAAPQPERVCYLSNLKSRKIGERSSVSLRRAMKASKKSAYWSSRHIAPTVLRAWHCAGAKVVRKKTVLFVKGRRSVFWPTLKSFASASQRLNCARLPGFTKPSDG